MSEWCLQLRCLQLPCPERPATGSLAYRNNEQKRYERTERFEESPRATVGVLLGEVKRNCSSEENDEKYNSVEDEFGQEFAAVCR